MYTPHTVTLIIADETDDGMNYNSVVLSGVFLDRSKRSNVNRSGLADADSATLFIPMDIQADKQYLPPKEYHASEHKEEYWTLFDGGEISGAECYFVKGIVEPLPYAQAREQYDACYHVTTVDERDFGHNRKMWHWMVGGR